MLHEILYGRLHAAMGNNFSRDVGSGLSHVEACKNWQELERRWMQWFFRQNALGRVPRKSFITIAY